MIDPGSNPPPTRFVIKEARQPGTYLILLDDSAKDADILEDFKASVKLGRPRGEQHYASFTHSELSEFLGRVQNFDDHEPPELGRSVGPRAQDLPFRVGDRVRFVSQPTRMRGGFEGTGTVVHVDRVLRDEKEANDAGHTFSYRVVGDPGSGIEDTVDGLLFTAEKLTKL